MLLRGVVVCHATASVSAEFGYRVFRKYVTVSFSLHHQIAGNDGGRSTLTFVSLSCVQNVVRHLTVAGRNSYSLSCVKYVVRHLRHLTVWRRNGYS